MLEDLGVTAVLNAAQGEMTDWNYVNTKASYYSGKGIREEDGALHPNTHTEVNDCLSFLISIKILLLVF